VQRPASAAQLASRGAKLDPRHIERLGARDQGADIAVLRDGLKGFQSVGEGGHVMAAFFNQPRHRPLNRAARIDQYNAHTDSTSLAKPKATALTMD